MHPQIIANRRACPKNRWKGFLTHILILSSFTLDLTALWILWRLNLSRMFWNVRKIGENAWKSLFYCVFSRISLENATKCSKNARKSRFWPIFEGLHSIRENVNDRDNCTGLRSSVKLPKFKMWAKKPIHHFLWHPLENFIDQKMKCRYYIVLGNWSKMSVVKITILQSNMIFTKKHET